MNLVEEIVIHDTLNPKLWDIENNKLRPEVREKIIQICDAFEDYLEAPIQICDIQIVGSNCSFNWTEHSDLDVHIIANYEAVTQNTELLDLIYSAKKSQFNSKYDITVHGVEIEMYIQDVKSGIASNGIYSVCDDKWIKEPKPIKNIKNYDVSQALAKWQDKISQVLESNDRQEINNVINMLYLMRHNSIAKDGEYGEGNQLFKEIRALGLLDKLRERLDEVQSKELSLEGYTRGQIVNRY